MAGKASEFVGDIPQNYDQRLGPIIFEDYADDIARRAAALRPMHVLELAAGTGIVSRRLKDAIGPDARLTVTDLNAQMLDIAKAKFGRDENVDFVVADAMALDFANETFDLIVCQFGVMFFPDKAASFKEALRVLKPGGAYLLNTWGSLVDNPFAAIAQDTTAEFFPSDPPGFYRVPFSYHDAEAVKADMMRGGFQDVAHETLPIQKPVADWEHFGRGLVYGNPLIDEIKNRGGVDPEAVATAITKGLSDALGDVPCTMPIEATVFHGRAG